MDPSESGANPRANSIETAIDARLDSIDSPGYRRNSDSVLNTFADWADQQFGVTELSDVDAQLCRRYAQHLRSRAHDDDDLSASSARRYYAILRAWLGWCVRDGRIDTNPAERQRAEEELPADEEKHTTQFWTPRQRKRLLSHLDERVDRALSDEETGHDDQVREMRDRALGYVLGLAGVRIGEVLRDSGDPKRDGVRWGDLDLDTGRLEIFGKAREYEQTAVPSAACDRLDRYKRLVDPSSERWPIFPTLHRPTLYSHVRETLRGRGMDSDEIEELLDGPTIFAVYREHDLVPQAMTTTAGRQVLKRVCSEIDLALDDGEEYLMPHGARRGLGDQLYEESAELAQEMLRHRSIETTHSAYRDQHVEERREKVDEILNDE